MILWFCGQQCKLWSYLCVILLLSLFVLFTFVSSFNHRVGTRRFLWWGVNKVSSSPVLSRHFFFALINWVCTCPEEKKIGKEISAVSHSFLWETMRSLWDQSEAVADFSCFSVDSPEKQVQKISAWAPCKFQRRSHQALSDVSECLLSAGKEQGLSGKVSSLTCWS